MNRRSFLRMLGLAPVAAVGAVTVTDVAEPMQVGALPAAHLAAEDAKIIEIINRYPTINTRLHLAEQQIMFAKRERALRG